MDHSATLSHAYDVGTSSKFPMMGNGGGPGGSGSFVEVNFVLRYHCLEIHMTMAIAIRIIPDDIVLFKPILVTGDGKWSLC